MKMNPSMLDPVLGTVLEAFSKKRSKAQSVLQKGTVSFERSDFPDGEVQGFTCALAFTFRAPTKEEADAAEAARKEEEEEKQLQQKQHEVRMAAINEFRRQAAVARSANAAARATSAAGASNEPPDFDPDFDLPEPDPPAAPAPDDDHA